MKVLKTPETIKLELEASVLEAEEKRRLPFLGQVIHDGHYVVDGGKPCGALIEVCEADIVWGRDYRKHKDLLSYWKVVFQARCGHCGQNLKMLDVEYHEPSYKELGWIPEDKTLSATQVQRIMQSSPPTYDTESCC